MFLNVTYNKIKAKEQNKYKKEFRYAKETNAFL